MIKYINFINESTFQKKPKELTRKDLNLGTVIKTSGQWDSVNITGQIGTIIEMKEYGYILVDFFESFSPRLHSGHLDIGTPKHCFYVHLNNITEIIPDELANKIRNRLVVPFRASSDLLRIFKRMKFEPDGDYHNISFFDVDKNNPEVLTYLPAKKFEGDPDTKKGRQAMKVGRVLKTLKPGLTDAQLEQEVVSYRTAYKIIILGEGKNLDVVTGEDIRYWYSNSHYAMGKRGGCSTELWNSCMSSPSTKPVFNLYCENPDKIALCVYTNEDDKLMARALVWRLDDGNVYMDRIYSNAPEERKMLIDYANKNDMKSYSKGGTGRMEVTLPKDYGGKHRPVSGNPYMDTFRNSVVSNDGRYYLSNQNPPAGTYKSVRGV
jgi:hypothetical protein